MEETAEEPRKQGEIIYNLENEINKFKIKTDKGQENEDENVDVEDLGTNHGTNGNDLGFHENRNGNVEKNTKIFSTLRNGKTQTMLNKEKNSIFHRTVDIFDVSVQKRFLSPSALPQPQERIAFSAYLSHSIDNMSMGYTIKMDKVYLNDGSAYNTQTGVFSVPRSGVYLLTYTIYDYRVAHKLEVELVVDNKSMGSAKAEATGIDHQVQATKILILPLNAGQSVWLQTYYEITNSIYSGSYNRFTTFSGVLLY